MIWAHCCCFLLMPATTRWSLTTDEGWKQSGESGSPHTCTVEGRGAGRLLLKTKWIRRFLTVRIKILSFSSLPAKKRNWATFKLSGKSSAKDGLQYTRMNKEKSVFQVKGPLMWARFIFFSVEQCVWDFLQSRRYYFLKLQHQGYISNFRVLTERTVSLDMEWKLTNDRALIKRSECSKPVGFRVRQLFKNTLQASSVGDAKATNSLRCKLTSTLHFLSTSLACVSYTVSEGFGSNPPGHLAWYEAFFQLLEHILSSAFLSFLIKRDALHMCCTLQIKVCKSRFQQIGRMREGKLEIFKERGNTKKLFFGLIEEICFFPLPSCLFRCLAMCLWLFWFCFFEKSEWMPVICYQCQAKHATQREDTWPPVCFSGSPGWQDCDRWYQRRHVSVLS